MASCFQAKSQDLCHDDTDVVKASINAFMPPLSLVSTFLSDISSVRNPSHVFLLSLLPTNIHHREQQDVVLRFLFL